MLWLRTELNTARIFFNNKCVCFSSSKLLCSKNLGFNFLIAKTYCMVDSNTIPLYHSLSLLKQLPVLYGGRQVMEISEEGRWEERG